MNPTKTKVSSCAPVERFCSTVVLLLLKTRWKIKKEEMRTGLGLRQTELIQYVNIPAPLKSPVVLLETAVLCRTDWKNKIAFSYLLKKCFIVYSMPHHCVCPNPGPGCSTPYVLVFCVQWFEARELIVRIVDFGRIAYHHCLNYHFITTT